MRRIVPVVLTAALTIAGIALPVVTIPVAAATPVSPEIETLPLDGVDPQAAADPTAIDAPVDPEQTDTQLSRALALAEAQEPEGVHEDHADEVAPLESVQDPDLAALSGLERTEAFTVAGITWDATSTEEVIEVVVRIREDGRWGEWTTLPASEGLADSERTGTEPIASAGADGIQARVRTVSGEAPSGLRIELIDAGDSAADASAVSPSAPAASASAANGYEIKPTVVTRKGWGADEKLRRGWGTPDQSAVLNAMYVHHTVSSNSYAKGDGPKLVRGIYAYHTKSMKWPDIGYQFLVDKYGSIYEGRYGAVDTLPIGAQAGGYNTTTIGISAIGNLETGKPTTAMVDAIARVLAWKAYQHGLDPLGTARLTTGTSTKSGVHAKPGEVVTVNVIQGHRDTNITACPGKYLYAKLPEIRTKVKTLVDQAVGANGPAGPALPAPVVAAHHARQNPAQLDASSTYSWQTVPGAVMYELLTRVGSHGGAMTDSRGWGTYATVTATSATVRLDAGASRIVAVRGVDSAGRRGALSVLTQTARPVAASATAWSSTPAWVNESGNAATNGNVSGVLRSTTVAGARVAVSSVRDARRIVVYGQAGPGHGRTQVLVGSTVVGTLDWSSAAAEPAASRVVDLPVPTSGKVSVVTLDAARVALSALAFPRLSATTEVPAAPTPPPVGALAKPALTRPAATVAPVRLSSKATLRWAAVPGATSYKVQVRTAAHGKGYGAWKTVATTTSRKYVVTIASGASAQVGVRAVAPGRTTSARATFPTITRPVSTGTLVRSKGSKAWTTVRHGSYFRDFAFSTKKKGATIAVTKVKSAKTIQVTAGKGKGYGRIAVYAGTKKVKTFSLKAAKTSRLSRLNVTLPKAFSGTVTVKTLDAKTVRVSAVTTAR